MLSSVDNRVGQLTFHFSGDPTLEAEAALTIGPTTTTADTPPAKGRLLFQVGQKQGN
jgi:hypothetical protein